jgi:plastocyanin
MRHPARIAASAAAAAAAAAALAVAATANTASHPKLTGTVGKNDAYKITLKTTAGKLVKTLKAGTYTVVIHDDSTLHNYELDGPHGKSWTFTSVRFKGTKTFTLKLVKGKYKAYCAPHESVMFQHFTVK